MQNSLLKKWTNQLETFKTPTKRCKTCFKLIKSDSFYETINNDSCLCRECQNKFVPYFIKFRVAGVDGLAIYKYDDNIKSLLYQFKGCYDIELAPVFMNNYKNELRTLYKGYIVVPAPSFLDDDEERGFNHVIEMFKFLNLPTHHIIDKTSRYKQAENKKRERGKIIDHFSVGSLEVIKNKKVLIVDDVMTTGSTLKAMVGLLLPGHPKTIKILVMAKRTTKY